jgi:hypothetical protein
MSFGDADKIVSDKDLDEYRERALDSVELVAEQLISEPLDYQETVDLYKTIKKQYQITLRLLDYVEYLKKENRRLRRSI